MMKKFKGNPLIALFNYVNAGNYEKAIEVGKKSGEDVPRKFSCQYVSLRSLL